MNKVRKYVKDFKFKLRKNVKRMIRSSQGWADQTISKFQRSISQHHLATLLRRIAICWVLLGQARKCPMQHVQTEWPNACNMRRWQCCDRLNCDGHSLYIFLRSLNLKYFSYLLVNLSDFFPWHDYLCQPSLHNQNWLKYLCCKLVGVWLLIF